MKDFIKILRTYIPPYKKHLYRNFIFNFLGALFGVFSIVSMIPALKILFDLEQPVYEFMPWKDALSSFGELTDALQNNIYYLITQVMEKQGAVLVLVYIGLFLIFMTFLKVGFTYMASYTIVTLRNSVIRDIRNKIYKKTVSLPIGFFTEEKKGDIMSRITGDVTEVEASIMNSLDMFLKNPVIIIVYVTAMVVISWQLTLFVFLLFPAAGMIIGRIGKSLKKRSLKGQNKLGELLTTVEETLSGLRIIQAFNAEKKIYKRFHQENEDYRSIMTRLLRRRYLAHPVSEFLGTIVMIAVMWYGGHLIINGGSSLSPDQFIVYLGVFYSIINPVKSFSQEYYSIQKGLASMERINRILDSENNIVEKPDAMAVHTFNDKIEYRDVFFRYGSDYVLQNINLELRKGQTIALVGHSGSGKSTLADLLPRFYDVVKGQILLDGHDLRDFKVADVRALMGIVNQDPILFNDTFHNNIAFGVESASEDEVIHAAKVAHAHDFIISSDNGYGTVIGDRGSKLSGGQRQRISIARAILKNPPVMILDEATSALDTESEKLVQDALSKLMANRTSIVIAHRLSTIVNADRIFVLQNGWIVEQGTHEELIAKNGEYRKFYEMQYFK